MIKIHQSSETGLQIVSQQGKGCWVDVSHPTPDDVAYLTNKLGIPKEFVTASLNPHEISHIEKSDGALLILVRIPHSQGATARIPYVTIPLGIILAHESITTICADEPELLSNLSHEHQSDLSTANSTRFVLHLLWSIANNYIRYVGEIDTFVEAVEERLQRSLENREVLELLRYQKSLVHFTTALRANETMLERLQRSKSLAFDPKDEDLLDDVFTENRQAIGLSEIASDILSQMMDAFASIISNNLNVVMKFMASVTVILIIPTIISTFYGMNVQLPINDHPAAFLVLVGVSILGAIIVGVILWKKNWL